MTYIAEEVGHACAPFILITYFYLEFHMTLNTWGSLGLHRYLDRKRYLFLKEPLIDARKSVFSLFHQEI